MNRSGVIPVSVFAGLWTASACAVLFAMVYIYRFQDFLVEKNVVSKMCCQLLQGVIQLSRFERESNLHAFINLVSFRYKFLFHGYMKLRGCIPHTDVCSIDGRNPAPVGLENTHVSKGFIDNRWLAGFLPSTVESTQPSGGFHVGGLLS